MKKYLAPIAMVFLAVMLLTNCEKSTVSNVPYITFKSFEKIVGPDGKDSLLSLTVSFKDGDGDDGLSQTDTFPPFNIGSIYYYDFYIIYFVNKNGVFVPDTVLNSFASYDSITNTHDTIPIYLKHLVNYNSRIPNLSTTSANALLTGDINIKMSTYDMGKDVRFSIYIYDRALHQSNIITTPDVQLNPEHPGPN